MAGCTVAVGCSLLTVLHGCETCAFHFIHETVGFISVHLMDWQVNAYSLKQFTWRFCAWFELIALHLPISLSLSLSLPLLPTLLQSKFSKYLLDISWGQLCCDTATSYISCLLWFCMTKFRHKHTEKRHFIVVCIGIWFGFCWGFSTRIISMRRARIMSAAYWFLYRCSIFAFVILNNKINIVRRSASK